MAAIDGFDLAIDAGDDIAVGPGRIDGVAVPGATLSATAADGDYAVVYDGTEVVAQAVATALTAGEIKLGEFTVDTNAATAVGFDGRGDSVAASA